MMMQIPLRRLRAVVLATTLVALLPAVALGHAELETATPSQDSTVTTPVTEVSATFSEALSPNGSGFELLDAQGDLLATGGIDPADDQRMVLTVDPALADGLYTVRWVAVAADGHVERGEWDFTVAVAASAPPSAAPTGTPAASATPSSVPSATASAAPTSAPSATAAPSPSGSGSETSGGSDVLLPIIVALIVVGAGAAYLLSQRNRPSDSA